MNGDLTRSEAPAGTAEASRTGRLKLFIGMAAGVGKTYQMLLEGHAEQEAGRDVVVGLLETHGRADTARLAQGLPMIPRRRVSYRETRDRRDGPAGDPARGRRNCA